MKGSAAVSHKARGMTAKAKPKAKAMPSATSSAADTSFVDQAAWSLLEPIVIDESSSSTTPDLTSSETVAVVQELVDNDSQHCDEVLALMTDAWEDDGGNAGGTKQQSRARGTKHRGGKKVQYARLMNVLKQIRDNAEEAMQA